MHALLSLALLVPPIACQQIWDILSIFVCCLIVHSFSLQWQTKWDRTKLFTSLAPSTPINFVSPGVIGSADIDVDDSQTFQSVWGFGRYSQYVLPDSSALILSNMKATNSDNYFELLNYMFSPTDGANAAGLNYIRVPLGASDFSANTYSYDDTSGDTSFSDFNIGKAPSYVYSVLKDIQSISSSTSLLFTDARFLTLPYCTVMKVHILPWSPPGWMKSSGTMDGGSLDSQYVSIYANYLLKCLQGFKSEGITSLYAISIQNEPENSDSTYPSTSMPVSVHAQIGIALRTLMDDNGFSTVKLIGYEHNWDDTTYPIDLMEAAPDAFDGVAFHCYAGDVTAQDTFHTAYPTKEIYFTECSGTIGSDWWSDIKWYMDNLFIGAVTHNAHAALMWNIALDGNGDPKLPGTDSCGGAGCRAIVQVNSDGTYSVNQEFYSMAQASKAIIPKDVGGAFGQRIGVTVGGELNWALIVGAYVTTRVNPTDWLRYSLVVLNWDDSIGGWNPTDVTATIEFRGMQATYTFPVGVTTLWWYAPPTSFNGTKQETEIYTDTDGKQQVLGVFA
ncbi:Glucan endo-1,6-beta-glucosidase [Mycena sanguinolenta]|uniref:Glucan endo-1,6-beta-glucosidase n=1 Tax=Mycena sanguinolenta TaxID=230812 RepID=A0A8H6Z6P2_9AGAR|nr:Glucan endo-1,6-beta-glucosidase [Mycena sanguinolenta]